MSAKEQFLSNQQRYQPLVLPQRFSDEEMVRDWTLTKHDYLVSMDSFNMHLASLLDVKVVSINQVTAPDDPRSVLEVGQSDLVINHAETSHIELLTQNDFFEAVPMKFWSHSIFFWGN